MPTSERAGYHHGDLRATLLKAATQMLEAGEQISLRSLARRAAVSPTAMYRHFEDRDALMSELAAQGFRDLRTELVTGRRPPYGPADLVEFAVAYAKFATRRPALFGLMFGQPCDDANDQRVRAAAELRLFLAVAIGDAVPGVDAVELATASWGLAHGLASLVLDGKLTHQDSAGVDALIRSSFAVLLSVGSLDQISLGSTDGTSLDDPGRDRPARRTGGPSRRAR